MRRFTKKQEYIGKPVELEVRRRVPAGPEDSGQMQAVGFKDVVETVKVEDGQILEGEEFAMWCPSVLVELPTDVKLPQVDAAPKTTLEPKATITTKVVTKDEEKAPTVAPEKPKEEPKKPAAKKSVAKTAPQKRAAKKAKKR